jgi:hypothetical protein
METNSKSLPIALGVIGGLAVVVAVAAPRASKAYKAYIARSDAAYNAEVEAARNAKTDKMAADAWRKGFNVIPGLGDLLFGKG